MTQMTTYKAHDWLKRLYHYFLFTKEGREAKKYLISRGIKEETIKTFKIGYAPKKSSFILKFLKAKGFSYNQLVSDNILRRSSNGKLSNIFRNRIVFPIQDYTGRTVAFGGRLINQTNTNMPKYINSPESTVFKKKDNLFGFDLAKEEIDNHGYAVLLEGYFDVIKAHQEGIKNVVASLGTALTINQALLLKSLTNNVVIAYDGDESGMENSFRAATVLDSVGCNVRIAHTNNQDPDEFISQHGGKKYVDEVIKKSQDVKLTLIDYKKQNYNLKDAIERYEYTEKILNVISKGTEDEEYKVLNRLEKVLGISFETVEKVLVNN